MSSLAKWLGVCLQTKWLWARISLLSGHEITFVWKGTEIFLNNITLLTIERGIHSYESKSKLLIINM